MSCGMCHLSEMCQLTPQLALLGNDSMRYERAAGSVFKLGLLLLDSDLDWCTSTVHAMHIPRIHMPFGNMYRAADLDMSVSGSLLRAE